MPRRNPRLPASSSASEHDATGKVAGIEVTGTVEWDPPRAKPTPKLLQIDAPDATILKFLAGTTFRDTETSIIKRAVRREMAAMLRARGYVVDETDPQTGAFTVSAP